MIRFGAFRARCCTGSIAQERLNSKPLAFLHETPKSVWKRLVFVVYFWDRRSWQAQLTPLKMSVFVGFWCSGVSRREGAVPDAKELGTDTWRTDGTAVRLARVGEAPEGRAMRPHLIRLS
jgi:hypothetical protein